MSKTGSQCCFCDLDLHSCFELNRQPRCSSEGHACGNKVHLLPGSSRSCCLIRISNAWSNWQSFSAKRIRRVTTEVRSLQQAFQAFNPAVLCSGSHTSRQLKETIMITEVLFSERACTPISLVATFSCSKLFKRSHKGIQEGRRVSFAIRKRCDSYPPLVNIEFACRCVQRRCDKRYRNIEIKQGVFYKS